MKPLLIFVFCLCSTISILPAQIGAKIQPNPIVGTWNSDQLGPALQLILKEDHTGLFAGDVIKYEIKGSSIFWHEGEIDIEYHFNLQGDKLEISGGDLPSAIAFTRLGKSNTISTSSADPDQASTPSLIGSWSGGGEIIEFRNDGQCLVGGQTATYTYTAPWIEINASTGSIKVQASFESNDKLNLKVNGATAEYVRMGSNAASTPVVNATPTTGQGQIDQTLVGKWCLTNVNSYNQGSSYSSTCITLNADGTYEYASESSRDVNTSTYWAGTNGSDADKGTWYVIADRIYYNSPTKGQGSFRLEKRNHPKNVNDPMIVIDGTPYVTQYAKPPW